MKRFLCTKVTSISLLWTALFFFGCSEDSEDPGKGVHVVGTTFLDAGNTKATYWRNGVASKLEYTRVPSDRHIESAANSIAISGRDVIICGYEWTPFGETGRVPVAKYWKNGVGKFLTTADHFSEANAVTASPKGKVYIVGNEHFSLNHETSPGVLAARIWKDDEGHSLPATDYSSDALGITIDGEDIYVTGSDYDSVLDDVFAKYWKNGEGFRLSDSSAWDGRAKSIFVYDGDVYVTGSENHQGVYWLNGSKIELTSPDETKSYEGKSIFVNQTGVYVAGRSYFFDGIHAESEAIYWKDGVPIHLTDNSFHYSEANSIFVDDEDVYVAGIDYGLPVYWKNGIKVILSEDYGVANSITVVR
jgi:hypothetical protein